MHWRDPKFRHFRDELDSALQQFERAQEWADLIRYLQRVQRILTKYSQLPVVPDKILVAKRLFQCLNSSLPSGVHLTTLQTYELIFSRIGAARLARDLAFYTEGIFTLYRHASYQAPLHAHEPRQRTTHHAPLLPRLRFGCTETRAAPTSHVRPPRTPPPASAPGPRR